MTSKTQARQIVPAGRNALEKMQHQEFARRLYKILVEKGMTQSDLARACYGTTKNDAGYTVAKGRDRISMYIRGKAIPAPTALKKMAEVLGVRVSDLSPEAAADMSRREEPDFYIRKIPDESSAHIKIDRVVPLEAAYEIYGILLRYDALTSPKRHTMTPEQFEAKKGKLIEENKKQPAELEDSDTLWQITN